MGGALPAVNRSLRWETNTRSSPSTFTIHPRLKSVRGTQKGGPGTPTRQERPPKAREGDQVCLHEEWLLRSASCPRTEGEHVASGARWTAGRCDSDEEPLLGGLALRQPSLQGELILTWGRGAPLRSKSAPESQDASRAWFRRHAWRASRERTPEM